MVRVIVKSYLNVGRLRISEKLQSIADYVLNNSIVAEPMVLT